MRTQGLVQVAFLLALSMTLGCSQSANPEAERVNVKTVVDQFTQVFTTKDTTLLASIMAHDADMVGFGSDSVEHWSSWEAVRQGTEQQLAMVDSARATVRDQSIKIHASGLVAWFSEYIDWDLSAGGQHMHLAGYRFTGVLEKREGRWVFVQFHGSVPASQ